VALIYSFANIEIGFDMRIRDLLLLVFFSTIGLSAKFQLLKEGGESLAVLLMVAAVFLVVQDFTGVLLAKLMGVHPAYGLFGGSISFAGGYGTAIAWGNVAEEAGLLKAKEIGIAFATFGLIAGGILGGPIAERLINKNNHSMRNSLEDSAISDQEGEKIKIAPHIGDYFGVGTLCTVR
jgi:ESS family glutamate:Na+ symporter